MLKKLYLKYKELVSYVFWGAMTTAVNYCVYFLLTKLLLVNYIVSNVAAWVVAVVFAFVVNKLFVFDSKSWALKTVFAEGWKFLSARILSGVLETGILFLFVSVLKLPDGPVKIAAGVLVILLNYAVSKWLIFKKG